MEKNSTVSGSDRVYRSSVPPGRYRSRYCHVLVARKAITVQPAAPIPSCFDFVHFSIFRRASAIVPVNSTSEPLQIPFDFL